ncbi:MAG: hypothetical protein ACK4N4_04325 [Burkholderiales bacterium]
MRPLAEFSLAAQGGIRNMLADIDDTLATEGRLAARACTTMKKLHRAGLRVIPITARPASWCDRPYRAHVAGRWRGRRKRCVSFPL